MKLTIYKINHSQIKLPQRLKRMNKWDYNIRHTTKERHTILRIESSAFNTLLEQFFLAKLEA